MNAIAMIATDSVRCAFMCGAMSVNLQSSVIRTVVAQNVCTNRPDRSFGSNHVLFGGMI
jgi:hypothetical protein